MNVALISARASTYHPLTRPLLAGARQTLSERTILKNSGRSVCEIPIHSGKSPKIFLDYSMKSYHFQVGLFPGRTPPNFKVFILVIAASAAILGEPEI